MAGIFGIPKRRPGDSPILPAEAVNALIEVAREHKAGNLAPDLPERDASDDQATVVVRNDTGDSLPQFSVVMLGEPLFDPSGGDAALAAFKLFPRFTGLVPVNPDCIGYFGITLEPIGDGEQGTACVAGVVPVQVWVTNESDWYADASDNITYCLASGPTGNAQILWKQPGTGLVWAIVRLQPGPSFVVFAAEIHASGPPPANLPDFTDYRYWVRELNPLAATQTPGDPDYGKTLYNYQGGYWGPATNLAESSSHALGGTTVKVLVFGRRDIVGLWCYQFREPGRTALLDGDQHTDTNQHTATKGDVIYATGDTPAKWDALAAGAGYSILTMSTAGLPTWFAKGAEGKVLRISGGALVWGDPPPNALLDGHVHSDTSAHAPAAGDLVYADATGKWDGLGVGTAADILTVTGGLPAWFTHGADQDLLMMNGNANLGWFSKGANESILVTQAGALAWLGKGNAGDMLVTTAGGSLGWTPAPTPPTGATGGFVAVVGLRVDGTDLQAQTQSITVENGLITDIGDVSAWFTWHIGTDCSGT